MPRPPQIEGLDVDEFNSRNANPLWLHQNETLGQSRNFLHAKPPPGPLFRQMNASMPLPVPSEVSRTAVPDAHRRSPRYSASFSSQDGLLITLSMPRLTCSRSGLLLGIAMA